MNRTEREKAMLNLALGVSINPRKHLLPGEMVKRLKGEVHEAATELKSDDLFKIRPDAVLPFV